MSHSQATCRCSQVKAEVTGDPVRVSVCHCLACKQRTGSAFSYQARFPKANVKVTGRTKEYLRTADSGNRLTYNFCPDCGSTVYYQISNAPDLIAIPAGAFANPDFLPPRFSVYESRRHAWVAVTGDVEHSD